MSFLPTNYEVPQSGNYMKLMPGKNRFRVLSAAIIGNEFWRSKEGGREPVRRRMNETIAANELEINPKDGSPEKVKHFWAFAVWNYAAKSVQILELTQKSIMGSIQALVEEADWGDPMGYDIIVSKKGNGLETEYAVQPAPSKALDPTVAAAFAATPINLEALFDGGDPFKSNGAAKTTSSQHEAVAISVTSSPASLAGKRKAWDTYRAIFPNTPVDEVQEGFRQAFRAYFPGRKVELTSAGDWEKFTLDAFERPKVKNPISADEEFADADIPF
jgi:hypothetical protein